MIADSCDRQAPELTWEIEIKRDGVIWPFVWSWRVVRREGRPSYGTSVRSGDSLTKDRARRKALKAKRSMQDDDVTVVYS